MKILFFSYAYPNPFQTGLATFNRTMIAGLAKQHEVQVFSPVPFTDVWKATVKGQLPRGLNDSTFQAVSNVRAQYHSWFYTPKCFRTRYGTFMSLSVRTALDQTMRDFRPDVMLSYWTHPDGEVAVKTAHRHGIRAVTMVGGSDVLLNGRHGSRRKAVLDVLHAADAVVTVSEDIKQVLVADGIPTEKLNVVRRGIDKDLFHRGSSIDARRRLGLPEDRPILVSVGRLVDVKGHTHLIEACRLMAERGLSFHCYFLGDGPLRTNLQQQIDKSGLNGMVELRGSQSPARLADWYRAANLSVLASFSEGVPNVLLESIACGTPFVASNVGGIPEIADPSLDRLVAPASPAALADALASQLSAPVHPMVPTRRFEPQTVAESAVMLSNVIQDIASGRKARNGEWTTLHETMTEKDLADENPIDTCDISAAQLSDEDVNLLSIDGDELCARTGEGFAYQP